AAVILVGLLGFTSAPADPELLAVVASRGDNQSGLVLAPNGQTAWWSAWDGVWGKAPAGPRKLYRSERSAGIWSAATLAAFSGEYHDDDPFVSPDGRWLYFVSERPGPSGEAGNADIFRTATEGGGPVERLSVNSPAAEYSPVITASGDLYFASARAGGTGRGDLYLAQAQDAGFAEPQLLGPAVNASTGEWNLWVDPAGQLIVFEASSRSTNLSVPGDLYASWRTPAGLTAALPLSWLNTPHSDLLLRPVADAGFSLTRAPLGGHAAIEPLSFSALADAPASNLNTARMQLERRYAPALLVVNRSSHEVSILNLARGEVETRISTGAGPHLPSNVDAGRLVITGYGEFPKPHAEPVTQRPPFETALNSTLTLLDLSERRAVRELTLDHCLRPHASWLRGDRVYATCEDEQAVVEIDWASGRELRRFDTRQAGSHVLSFDSASGTLGVSNTGGGSLTRIHLASGVVAVTPLAAGSEGALALDGEFWVANGQHGSISAVDAATGEPRATSSPLCSFPIAISRDLSDALLWVACFGSAELLAVQRQDLKVARRLKLTAQPLHVLTHPTRPLAYVSWPRRNSVAEIDLESGREIREISVGIEPDGLRWVPLDAADESRRLQ
ncbi:MAG: hypothetical protein AAGA23_22255, partial [Pseudomonadota bacterium]